MLKANIVQESNIRKKRRVIYETLTAEERDALYNKTVGYGNMAKCEDATEMTRNTVMKAMSGGKIIPEKAIALRLYLADLPCKKADVKEYMAAQSQTTQR